MKDQQASEQALLFWIWPYLCKPYSDLFFDTTEKIRVGPFRYLFHLLTPQFSHPPLLLAPSPLHGFPQKTNEANIGCPHLSSNSFFLIPVFHFPWSEKGREARLTKSASHTV